MNFRFVKGSRCLDFNLWVGDGCLESYATDAAKTIDANGGWHGMVPGSLLCTQSYFTWESMKELPTALT